MVYAITGVFVYKGKKSPEVYGITHSLKEARRIMKDYQRVSPTNSIKKRIRRLAIA